MKLYKTISRKSTSLSSLPHNQVGMSGQKSVSSIAAVHLHRAMSLSAEPCGMGLSAAELLRVTLTGTQKKICQAA